MSNTNELFAFVQRNIVMWDKWMINSLQYNQYIVKAQNKSMSIRETLMSKCQICSRQNTEFKMIFKQLCNKFKSLLSSLELDDSLRTDSESENEGFAQLLRVFNIQKSQKTKGKVDCKHPHFLKMMLKSLNCNLTTLNYLCEITANSIAEKNYRLALIESQFKNVGQRIANHNINLVQSGLPSSSIKIEEPIIVSMTSLPVEKQSQALNEKNAGVLGVTQTSIEEMGVDFVGSGYGFYYQFPMFFGRQE